MTRQMIIRGGGVSLPPLVLALASFMLASGCGSELEHPKSASPIVQPESEAAKKAIAETEKMLRLRQEQEAKARKRLRGVPSEG